jgi:hypothetical protein
MADHGWTPDDEFWQTLRALPDEALAEAALIIQLERDLRQQRRRKR